jgi:hypothetical protein
MALLRRHHLDGRLTSTEFEERADEVYNARFHADLWTALRELPVPRPAAPAPPAPPHFVQPPPGAGNAGTALVLGAIACCLLLFSVGMLFPLIIPLGGTAWVLGRRAARDPAIGQRRGTARTGEILGMIATIASLTAFLGWTAIFLLA